MIKTIFFDFGRVISGNHNSWDGMHKRIKEETGLTAEELDKIFQKHWEDISVNKESETDFLKEVATHAKKEVSVNQLADMFAADTKIDSNVIEIMRNLRDKGLRIVILANESKIGEETRLKKIADVVDEIYSSATLRLRKPDPAIYKFVLRKEKLTPDEALFIDDKERNTVAAEALGIKTILYKNPAQLKEELKKYLKN